MALPLSKPTDETPELEPISENFGSDFRSQDDRIIKPLKSAINASDIKGPGLRKVIDITERLGRKMITDTAGDINFQDELENIIDEASQENSIEAMTDEDAENVLGDGLAANDNVENLNDEMDPAEAINSFGNDPEGLAANDDVETNQPEAEQPAPAQPEQTTTPTPAPEQTPTSPGAGAAQPTPEQTQQQPESQAPVEPEPEAEPEKALDSTTPTPPPQEEGAPPTTAAPGSTPDQSPSPTSAPEQRAPAQPEQTTTPTPTAEQTPASPGAGAAQPTPEQTPGPAAQPPAEQPPQQPESPAPVEPEAEAPLTPEKNPLAAEEGEPFVKTDDAGHPLPQTKEGAAGGQNQGQEGAPNPDGTQVQSEASPNQGGPAQNPPQRGIMMQTINQIRNNKLIKEINKKMAELNKDKGEIEKKIKKINEELKPMEREHFWLEVAKWSLILAEIFLMFLAAVLASTIIFLFIIPLAPAVWLSANIPAVAREATDLKISDLDKKMEKKKKERTDEEKKLKDRNQQIAKLARERFKLINQVPFARNNLARNKPTAA